MRKKRESGKAASQGRPRVREGREDVDDTGRFACFRC
jgi:hypothetical protein